MRTNVPANSRTLPARVYRDLRRRILRQELAPGALLRIREVCEHYEISATPVREALRLLEADGLVLHRPYQGCFVAPLDCERTIASLEARLALELYAVAKGLNSLTDAAVDLLADLADRMVALPLDSLHDHIDEVMELDDRFHGVLVGLAGNPVINDLYHSFHIHTYVARALLPANRTSDARARLDEHHQILRLCLLGDVPALQAAIRRHIEQVQANIRAATLRGQKDA